MKSAWHALAAYSAIAIVATWPLTRGLGRDVAWDLGDPLLVMWVIAWDCEQILHILRGDFSRIGTFFDANMFHPAPLTLAYSEHFIAQAVQVLPVYAVTKNPILCYNLLFLSTFILSGVGAYLLVRQLTGNGIAAFIAGLLFAFAPYRIPQSSHLQVLSSQWMPFALYGFRRYFDTRRVRPLIGAAAALVAQNLSCGYYMLYFGPIAAIYVVWEMASRRLLRDGRTWIQFIAAGALVAIVTVPFLLPYAAVRDQLELGRARGEVLRYSADVYSYFTAYASQPVWGRVANAYHKPEGDLFPGVIALVLAAIGLVFGRSKPESTTATTTIADESRSPRKPLPAWIAPLFLVLAAAHVVAAAFTLLYRRVTIDVGLFDLHMSNLNQLFLRAAILFAVAALVSPAVRARLASFSRSRGFFAAVLLLALWLSLGPFPQALGRPLELFGLYGVLFDHVPGFDGLRVPARFAMIVTLMLAVLGGFGADAIGRFTRLRLVLAIAAIVFLAEGLSLPFTVNGAEPPVGFNAPEARVRRAARAPAVYGRFAQEPADAALVELPLGQPDYDLRAVFYSTAHWRHLLNGYSGFFPRHYGELAVAVSDVPRHPDVALDALRALRATHVLVHENAYVDDQGRNTSTALLHAGARELFRENGDVLLALPR